MPLFKSKERVVSSSWTHPDVNNKVAITSGISCVVSSLNQSHIPGLAFLSSTDRSILYIILDGGYGN